MRSDPGPGPGQRAALFDVDGVLSRGFTMLAFGRFLLRQGLVDRRGWLLFHGDFSALWQGKLSYPGFARQAVRDFALALRGRNREDIASAAAGLCSSHLRLYWYTRRLVQLFRDRGIATIAISGSPDECVQPLAGAVGLDEYYGTSYAVDRQGVYTGEVRANRALAQGKEAVVRGLAHRFDLSRSFAFGDTTQDLAMLERVGCPVAMNPRRDLARVAAKRGWACLTFRHDVPRRVGALADWGCKQFDGAQLFPYTSKVSLRP